MAHFVPESARGKLDQFGGQLMGGLMRTVAPNNNQHQPPQTASQAANAAREAAKSITSTLKSTLTSASQPLLSSNPLGGGGGTSAGGGPISFVGGSGMGGPGGFNIGGNQAMANKPGGRGPAPPAAAPPPPDAVDMSHLTEEERLMIQSVMAKAQMVDAGIDSVPSAAASRGPASQPQQPQLQQQHLDQSRYSPTNQQQQQRKIAYPEQQRLGLGNVPAAYITSVAQAPQPQQMSQNQQQPQSQQQQPILGKPQVSQYTNQPHHQLMNQANQQQIGIDQQQQQQVPRQQQQHQAQLQQPWGVTCTVCGIRGANEPELECFRCDRRTCRECGSAQNQYQQSHIQQQQVWACVQCLPQQHQQQPSDSSRNWQTNLNMPNTSASASAQMNYSINNQHQLQASQTKPGAVGITNQPNQSLSLVPQLQQAQSTMNLSQQQQQQHQQQQLQQSQQRESLHQSLQLQANQQPQPQQSLNLNNELSNYQAHVLGYGADMPSSIRQAQSRTQQLVSPQQQHALGQQSQQQIRQQPQQQQPFNLNNPMLSAQQNADHHLQNSATNFGPNNNNQQQPQPFLTNAGQSINNSNNNRSGRILPNQPANVTSIHEPPLVTYHQVGSGHQQQQLQQQQQQQHQQPSPQQQSSNRPQQEYPSHYSAGVQHQASDNVNVMQSPVRVMGQHQLPSIPTTQHPHPQQQQHHQQQLSQVPSQQKSSMHHQQYQMTQESHDSLMNAMNRFNHGQQQQQQQQQQVRHMQDGHGHHAQSHSQSSTPTRDQPSSNRQKLLAMRAIGVESFPVHNDDTDIINTDINTHSNNNNNSTMYVQSNYSILRSMNEAQRQANLAPPLVSTASSSPSSSSSLSTQHNVYATCVDEPQQQQPNLPSNNHSSSHGFANDSSDDLYATMYGGSGAQLRLHQHDHSRQPVPHHLQQQQPNKRRADIMQHPIAAGSAEHPSRLGAPSSQLWPIMDVSPMSECEPQTSNSMPHQQRSSSHYQQAQDQPQQHQHQYQHGHVRHGRLEVARRHSIDMVESPTATDDDYYPERHSSSSDTQNNKREAKEGTKVAIKAETSKDTKDKDEVLAKANQVMEQQQVLIEQSQRLIQLQLEQQKLAQDLQDKMRLSNTSCSGNNGKEGAAADASTTTPTSADTKQSTVKAGNNKDHREASSEMEKDKERVTKTDSNDSGKQSSEAKQNEDDQRKREGERDLEQRERERERERQDRKQEAESQASASRVKKQAHKTLSGSVDDGSPHQEHDAVDQSLNDSPTLAAARAARATYAHKEREKERGRLELRLDLSTDLGGTGSGASSPSSMASASAMARRSQSAGRQQSLNNSNNHNGGANKCQRRQRSNSAHNTDADLMPGSGFSSPTGSVATMDEHHQTIASGSPFGLIAAAHRRGGDTRVLTAGAAVSSSSSLHGDSVIGARRVGGSTRQPTGLPPAPLPVAAAIQLHQLQQQALQSNQAAAISPRGAAFVRSRSVTSNSLLGASPTTSGAPLNDATVAAALATNDYHQSRSSAVRSRMAASVAELPTAAAAGGGGSAIDKSLLFSGAMSSLSAAGRLGVVGRSGSNAALLGPSRPTSPDTMSEGGARRRPRKRLPQPPSNAAPITPATVRKLLAQRSSSALGTVSGTLTPTLGVGMGIGSTGAAVAGQRSSNVSIGTPPLARTGAQRVQPAHHSHNKSLATSSADELQRFLASTYGNSLLKNNANATNTNSSNSNSKPQALVATQQAPLPGGDVIGLQPTLPANVQPATSTDHLLNNLLETIAASEEAMSNVATSASAPLNSAAPAPVSSGPVGRPAMQPGATITSSLPATAPSTTLMNNSMPITTTATTTIATSESEQRQRLIDELRAFQAQQAARRRPASSLGFDADTIHHQQQQMLPSMLHQPHHVLSHNDLRSGHYNENLFTGHRATTQVPSSSGGYHHSVHRPAYGANNVWVRDTTNYVPRTALDAYNMPSSYHNQQLASHTAPPLMRRNSLGDYPYPTPHLSGTAYPAQSQHVPLASSYNAGAYLMPDTPTTVAAATTLLMDADSSRAQHERAELEARRRRLNYVPQLSLQSSYPPNYYMPNSELQRPPRPASPPPPIGPLSDYPLGQSVGWTPHQPRYTKSEIIENSPQFSSIGYTYQTRSFAPSRHLRSEALASMPRHQQQRYPAPYRRILLSRNPKDRIGNGIGVKIVGGQPLPVDAPGGVYDSINNCVVTSGAFVSDVFHTNAYATDEIRIGDQIIEWNGVNLSNRSDEEVQQILISQFGDDEVEIIYLPSSHFRTVYGRTVGATPHNILPSSDMSSIDTFQHATPTRERRHKSHRSRHRAAGAYEPSSQREPNGAQPPPIMSFEEQQQQAALGYDATSMSSFSGQPMTETTTQYPHHHESRSHQMNAVDTLPQYGAQYAPEANYDPNPSSGYQDGYQQQASITGHQQAIDNYQQQLPPQSQRHHGTPTRRRKKSITQMMAQGMGSFLSRN